MVSEESAIFAKRLLRRLGRVELDIDLAHALDLSAPARGTRDFDVDDGAEFDAFVSDVVEDFCGCVSLSGSGSLMV